MRKRTFTAMAFAAVVAVIVAACSSAGGSAGAASPSAAASNDGGCGARMNDFSASITGGWYANRACVSGPTRTLISLSPSR